MVKEFLKWLGISQPKPKRLTEKDLIRAESKIGARLFGPISPNRRREFFNLDRKTWVWYEEWVDESGQRRAMTTRYEIRPSGVLKIQDGQAYHYVEGEELANLVRACGLYYQQVAEQVYRRPVVA